MTGSAAAAVLATQPAGSWPWLLPLLLGAALALRVIRRR
jgi:hypothetical protein